MIYWIAKIVAVVGLLGAAAAMTTPKGRIPLALRGILRVVKGESGSCSGRGSCSGSCSGRGRGRGRDGEEVAGWKKAVAFLLVLAAAAVAMIGRW